MPVFDGHNDTLLRLRLRGGDGAERAFLDGEATGQLDLPRARRGGFAGGLFAIFVPPEHEDGEAIVNELMTASSYDVPLPPELDRTRARREALAMMALLARIEQASNGRVHVCRDVAEIRECVERGVLAAVLHLEGADAIDPEFRLLERLHREGLRSLGLVWSRPNAYGHGVPFRYPASPDTGPGLTDLGRRLVGECNRLRIVVDLSHVTERGFWDVAAISDAPLVATHSNAHAICAHSRNLTDHQLAAIRASRGMVGVNFAATFLRADGRLDADTPIEQVLRHFDHLIDRLGEGGVGFGSDFDGATIPRSIGDVTGLPRIVDAMRARGYGEALIEKLCWRNWLGVLERTWGA